MSIKQNKASKNYAAGLVGKIPMGHKGDKAHSVIIIALGMKGVKAEISMNEGVLHANPQQLKAISLIARKIQMDTTLEIIEKIIAGAENAITKIKGGKKK